MPDQTEFELNKRDGVAALMPAARRLHLAVLSGFIETAGRRRGPSSSRPPATRGWPGAALADLADRDVVAFNAPLTDGAIGTRFGSNRRGPWPVSQ